MPKIKTVKTSLLSVLNGDQQSFVDKLEELVKKMHLLRVGACQFLHWYLVHVPTEERLEMNELFIELVLSILNGLFPRKSPATTRLRSHLIPFIGRFVQESSATHLSHQPLVLWMAVFKNLFQGIQNPSDYRPLDIKKLSQKFSKASMFKATI